MRRDRLLAKSGNGGRPPQTIRKHTAEVMRSAAALVEATGADQLRALGLDPDAWLGPFRRAVLAAALLHDLGKANDHFQGMIRGRRGPDRPQGLRHEAVSFLIARLPEVRRWIAPALEGACRPDFALWAAAGHHRKFPASTPEGSGARMTVHLDHPDFRRVLDLGRDFGLGLGTPPAFASGLELPMTAGGVCEEIRIAGVEAGTAIGRASADERKFLAAVKACLICADVAGSIGRRGGESMAAWIPDAFRRVPTADQLRGVVGARIKGGALRGFQAAIADAESDVVLALAGCGAGKTAAAYARAAARYPGRRVFFCYPTTGTATEGYRDYLSDPSLGADLIHGRSEVDKALLLGDAPADVEAPEIHDEEAAPPRSGDRAAEDSAGALEQWSTPLVGCTVDTVLGLVQNNRRGVYAWPSIAGSFCVFDEVHAYDERLFGALERFLRDVPGVPCLLMTASLPAGRLRRLRAAMEGRGAAAVPVRGPADLEAVPRYVRAADASVEAAWRSVRGAHRMGGKVLWVANTVDAAIELAVAADGVGLEPLVYHSRFRYADRVERHRAAVDAFDRRKFSGPSIVIATQVAEMSLDLSADLLVTELAPIAAIIQRLGRLNRLAAADGSTGTRPFIVLEPDGPLPYDEADLAAARTWLSALGGRPVGQRDLVERWAEIEASAPAAASAPEPDAHLWLDGGFSTLVGPLREGGPGLDVVLGRDAADVLAGRRRVEEVRVPMPPPRGRWARWREWPVAGFCPVAPEAAVEYDPMRGARWRD